MPDADHPAAFVIPLLESGLATLNISAPAAGGIYVVGVGSSAGGLDACRRFLSTLPATPGMAFVLVQHLDPTHESMMVELLSGSTTMQVVQVTDGMMVAANHIYLIPPGVYLAYIGGALHLSKPAARHGARLPFDFFLHTLATNAGAHSICVVLSGNGADGAIGCQAVKAAGGKVIVQDPIEAAYGGMPTSAIVTGAVDLILPVAKIAAALMLHARGLDRPERLTGLPQIITLLREKTRHDFTLYKPGTLERRIARRMRLAGIAGNDTARYLTLLGESGEERGLLTEDLLINVTQFFRDPKIFEILAASVVPELVNAARDQPIRIWVAGCSSGEETYSLAMLFQEYIGAQTARAKVQIFASDVDPQAIAKAREGLYAFSINTDVSAARLQRFFTKEDQGYRIEQDLRASVVFALQDVLSDPPFSQLDLISCRNVLIYLRPEAQTKVISIFNFALRKNAYLLLGSAETAGAPGTRFELVSKQTRLYRKITNIGPADIKALTSSIDTSRMPLRQVNLRQTTRPADIAEICKKLLHENFSPAAVLINSRMECLYSTGPTAAYMRIAPGYPSLNILTMINPALRARTKVAIVAAAAGETRMVMPGGRVTREGVSLPFNIDIQPIPIEGEKHLLLSFVDQPAPKRRALAGVAQDLAQFTALEQELEATRTELQGAFRALELSGEEQNAISEEALSVNEEYQSTNEELLTSKEELQSLNEELTALNGQLQETLERSRMTSNDLQNILYSTAVATLFLDEELRIRFFTPATKSLFTIIQSDIGRPLADFRSLAADLNLPDDAASVLRTSNPIEREIEAGTGIWFNRRILPYRTPENPAAGVVITFTNVTERKKINADLMAAQHKSERANLAKSRFLAAASHDLRQPLQTLTLLNSLLAKTTSDVPALKLMSRLELTTGTMAAMLNTLLDINQIDSGIVKPTIQSFPVDALLLRLHEEFVVQAQARGLALRIVRCRLNVVTDQGLLEQMIRNLLENALKYTKSGRVLLGCRRKGKMLRIKICDTGIGIPAAELSAIFDEFHQVNNPTRERNRGLGLGLSIVLRLSELLKLDVQVRSVLGKGSVFAIDVPFEPTPVSNNNRAADVETSKPMLIRPTAQQHRISHILILEDDETIRELLEQALSDEGYFVLAVADGLAAMRLVSSGAINPDLILADYNLPGELSGLEAVGKLHALQKYDSPVVILTGDTSTFVLHKIAAQNFVQFSKPMKLSELIAVIKRSLAFAPMRKIDLAEPPALSPEPTVFIVDDDSAICDDLAASLEADGRRVRAFGSCEAFLAYYTSGQPGCLLLDAELPGMHGLELLDVLVKTGSTLPSIMITGKGDIKMAVTAMQSGAVDFLEKPISSEALRRTVQRALDRETDLAEGLANKAAAATHIASLTARQLEIMDLILVGHPNKNIAADLGISQRTVENHRATIMKRTGAKSLPALARLAVAANRL